MEGKVACVVILSLLLHYVQCSGVNVAVSTTAITISNGYLNIQFSLEYLY